MKKQQLLNVILVLALTLAIFAGCEKASAGEMASDTSNGNQGIVYETSTDVTVDPQGETADEADENE